MDTLKKYLYKYPNALPFLSWLFFSLFYWYAAYAKPFSPTSFLSWVYADRCSYYELLTLRDTGIGHPPLFHILQKFVQDILPGYHFIYVRIINYILGSIFIVILTKYLTNFKKHIFFILSICISASVLNSFVYARMWGGVALFSIILIILGETYIKTKKKTYFLLIFVVILMGLFFDYNFILVFPYSFFVFIHYLENKKKLKIQVFSIFILFWLTAFIVSVYKFGYSSTIYTNLNNIYKMGFILYNLIFYAWYIEIVGLIMFLLGITLLIQYRKEKFNELHAFLGILLFLAIIFLFIENGYLRIRYGLLFLFVPFIFYFGMKNKLIFTSYNSRFILSIIYGSIIILVVSPLFWRDLVINRFIIVFLPFIIVLIYKNFSNNLLNIFAVILFFSGINFSFSSYLNDSFFPGYIKDNKSVIFEHPGFYASQYLKSDIKSNRIGKFLNLSIFDKSCRVCSMGTDNIDFSRIDSLYFVSYNQIPINLLLKGYKINNSEIFGITEFDKIQLKYLSLLQSKYCMLFEMKKIKKENLHIE